VTFKERLAEREKEYTFAQQQVENWTRTMIAKAAQVEELRALLIEETPPMAPAPAPTTDASTAPPAVAPPAVEPTE
jgi:hypothetical protein